MIKRTIAFLNPAYLSLRNAQMVVKLEKGDDAETRTLPIEDLGVVLLDHRQITITHGLMAALLENNVALITCDERHLPVGLMLPLEGNSIQSERFKNQLEASVPLRKQLWQQTIECKIHNQASVLRQTSGAEIGNMRHWERNVHSDDNMNLEGRAAAYYWKNMFPVFDKFTRDPDGDWPNPLLNYGYAILRAIIARALVCSGLLPTLGIHHKNRYNAYCLADDIMEPYRPCVDLLVVKILNEHPELRELTTDAKRQLLSIPTLDVVMGGQRSPLMIAATQTTASLAKCYAGEIRKISYPLIDEQI